MFATSCQFLVPCGPYLPNPLYSNGSIRQSSSHGHLLYDGEGRSVPLFDSCLCGDWPKSHAVGYLSHVVARH
jgi:hypothetical protein